MKLHSRSVKLEQKMYGEKALDARELGKEQITKNLVC